MLADSGLYSCRDRQSLGNKQARLATLQQLNSFDIFKTRSTNTVQAVGNRFSTGNDRESIYLQQISIEWIWGQISTWYIKGMRVISSNWTLLLLPGSSECKNISFDVDFDWIVFQELLISNDEILLGIFKCFINGFRLIVLMVGLILIL